MKNPDYTMKAPHNADASIPSTVSLGQNIVRLVSVAILCTMPDMVMGGDIWTLPAYQACLNNATDTELENLRPYEHLTDRGAQMTVKFCNRRIEQYRVAIGSESVSNDHCIYYDHPMSGQSALIITEADDVLSACISDPMNMRMVYQEAVEVNELGIKHILESDESNELGLQLLTESIERLDKRFQEMRSLVERNNIDFVGRWVSLLGPNGRLFSEEYNFSLSKD